MGMLSYSHIPVLDPQKMCLKSFLITCILEVGFIKIKCSNYVPNQCFNNSFPFLCSSFTSLYLIMGLKNQISYIFENVVSLIWNIFFCDMDKIHVYTSTNFKRN